MGLTPGKVSLGLNCMSTSNSLNIINCKVSNTGLDAALTQIGSTHHWLLTIVALAIVTIHDWIFQCRPGNSDGCIQQQVDTSQVRVPWGGGRDRKEEAQEYMATLLGLNQLSIKHQCTRPS